MGNYQAQLILLNNGGTDLVGLRSSLIGMNVRFIRGFEMNTAPKAIKKGMIKTTAGGLAEAFFLMLLVLLGQRVWTHIKSGGAK